MKDDVASEMKKLAAWYARNRPVARVEMPIRAAGDTRAFALARIASMATRPHMWSASREAFGLQLVLLVEIALQGEFSRAKAMSAVFGPGVTIGEGYNDAWVWQACAAAKALIEAGA